MFKIVVIYKNLEDLNDFRKFYLEVIFPQAKKVNGIIGTNITRVQQISEWVHTDLHDLQYILELHFESRDSLSKVGNTSDGQELLELLKGFSNGEFLYFMGNEQRFDKNHSGRFLDRPIWEQKSKETST
ncbi:hypothetical protein [Shimazuella kribbensis]|uniref:hypothetical protein n=1 Tax=Shimazuella kribbensis TaxID=139808 RepID=UPI000418808A|nr:hypothetical protein [Shimazuella kribbensis]